MNLEQLIGLAELRQQVRDIGDDLRIADTDLLGVVASNQFLEKLPQRMRFRNHASLGPLKAVLQHGLSNVRGN